MTTPAGRNDISYEVRQNDGAVVTRRLNPYGTYELEPGETLERAWSGPIPPAPLSDMALMANRDARLATADEPQEAMDGSPALMLLYNRKNVPEEDPAGPFGYIKWQLGPVGAGGRLLNGTTIEDVTDALIARLAGFQVGPFACDENAIAIDYYYAALNALEKRTAKRQAQGVEGTNAPHVS